MRRIRRWWCRTFRTRVEYAEYNRNAGKIVAYNPETDDPMSVFDFVPGYEVSRPDWWTWGARSGVTAETVEEARARLDEWQDDMARRPA